MGIKKINDLFSISTPDDFRETAIEVFRHQYRGNPIYRRFSEALGAVPECVNDLPEIPFLPIGFFRTGKILTGDREAEKVFLSSGTTGAQKSSHFVADLSLYRKSLICAFTLFYGPPADYGFLALTPTPEENPASSLVFMIDELMKAATPEIDPWFMGRWDELAIRIDALKKSGRKGFLIGLTHAWLDFSERHRVDLSDLIIMETGGMKGRRKEMVRRELHEVLCNRFNLSMVHSEYGMTELLSQAYSKGNGRFRTPPWMKILVRDLNDPLSYAEPGRAGGINIIDFANYHSCSFIATQDTGRIFPDGTFEVLGRCDESDLRGCSLMAV